MCSECFAWLTPDGDGVSGVSMKWESQMSEDVQVAKITPRKEGSTATLIFGINYTKYWNIQREKPTETSFSFFSAISI